MFKKLIPTFALLFAMTLFPFQTVPPVSAESGVSLENSMFFAPEKWENEMNKVPGVKAKFNPGDGPKLRELLSKEKYLEMDSDLQELMNNRQVGDTWNLQRVNSSSVPSTGVSPQSNGDSDCWASTGWIGCDEWYASHEFTLGGLDGNFSDVMRIIYKGQVNTNSYRSPKYPTTVIHNMEMRAHDANQDFYVTVGETKKDTISGYDAWLTAGYSEGRLLMVNPYEMILNDVWTSQKTRVTDGWGTDNNKCLYVTTDFGIWWAHSHGECNPDDPRLP